MIIWTRLEYMEFLSKPNFRRDSGAVTLRVTAIEIENVQNRN